MVLRAPRSQISLILLDNVQGTNQRNCDCDFADSPVAENQHIAKSRAAWGTRLSPREGFLGTAAPLYADLILFLEITMGGWPILNFATFGGWPILFPTLLIY